MAEAAPTSEGASPVLDHANFESFGGDGISTHRPIRPNEHLTDTMRQELLLTAY